jgi:hypothetical protein
MSSHQLCLEKCDSNTQSYSKRRVPYTFPTVSTAQAEYSEDDTTRCCNIYNTVYNSSIPKTLVLPCKYLNTIYTLFTLKSLSNIFCTLVLVFSRQHNHIFCIQNINTSIYIYLDKQFYMVYFWSLPWAQQLPQDILVDAGYLRDKATVLCEMIRDWTLEKGLLYILGGKAHCEIHVDKDFCSVS